MNDIELNTHRPPGNRSRTDSIGHGLAGSFTGEGFGDYGNVTSGGDEGVIA